MDETLVIAILVVGIALVVVIGIVVVIVVVVVVGLIKRKTKKINKITPKHSINTNKYIYIGSTIQVAVTVKP